jgi:glycosyltransferase involved in cell wall biosynthesis
MSVACHHLYAQQTDEFLDYVVVDPPHDIFKANRVATSNPPKVSFCIPTLNSEKTIEDCLKSIAGQAYSAIEIIIVDGGSSDRTLEIAHRYTNRVFYDKGTLGSARQTAMDHSTGEVIAIFDDDIVIPHSGWLRNAVQYFNYSDRVSTIWPVPDASPTASLTSRFYINIQNLGFQDRIRKRRGTFGGGNALFWKQCLEEIGGIDRSLHWGEDFDWARRLKEHAYQVVRINDVLYHDTMSSLREFAKKQFIGAETFLRNDFATVGLSKRDLIYEHLMFGTKGIAQGLLIERDYSWTLYPLFLLIRMIAYGSAYLKGTLTNDS